MLAPFLMPAFWCPRTVGACSGSGDVQAAVQVAGGAVPLSEIFFAARLNRVATCLLLSVVGGGSSLHKCALLGVADVLAKEENAAVT